MTFYTLISLFQELIHFEFSDTRKVTLRLTNGTGPVYLSGVLIQGQ
jgi:hypothetical protein